MPAMRRLTEMSAVYRRICKLRGSVAPQTLATHQLVSATEVYNSDDS